MKWKVISIAMVALIATVAVVAIIAAKEAPATRIAVIEDNAIEIIATAPPVAYQDIDTVAAGIAISSSHAGVITLGKDKDKDSVEDVVLDAGHVDLLEVAYVIAEKVHAGTLIA